ncbi:DUF6194 family protein [Amycolatopsis thermophila]|nr:DUF6194 family protein [Amycolatopsis thermophila]
MDIEQITQVLASFEGTRIAEAGGDVFALYDPRGDLPPERQMPWATIVTHDGPYDSASELDRDGVFRLNIGLPRDRFTELVDRDRDHDVTALDVLLPHPVYGKQHWVCVLNPDRTWPTARALLDEAHAFAVRKFTNADRRRR